MPGLLSNYLSVKRAEKVIGHIKGHVLDIGCGEARNYALIKAYNLPVLSYTGIEFSKDTVGNLTIRYPEAKFFQADLDMDRLPVDGKYDIIILLAVIEHIFNLKFLFSQLVSLLAENGQIVLTTPTPFGNDVVHRLGTKVGLFNKEGGQDDHIVIFNRKRLEILAAEFDMEVSRYQTFQFGCNQMAILTKNKKGDYEIINSSLHISRTRNCAT